MDYIKKVKNGDRLIYCSEYQFANRKIFEEKLAELKKYLIENKVNFKSTPAFDVNSDKHFVRILGLKDVKLWDVSGVIK